MIIGCHRLHWAMRIHSVAAAVLGSILLAARRAHAQHLPFERSCDVTGTPKLDVSTTRGKIDVTAGDTGRVVVSGTVTVRIGMDVPANALELARKMRGRGSDGRWLACEAKSERHNSRWRSARAVDEPERRYSRDGAVTSA